MKYFNILIVFLTLVFSITALYFYGLYRHEREYENVTDYGAKGDGITDDTDAIQRSIEGATAKKKKVYIHKGQFITTKPIVVYDNTTTIIGAEKGISVVHIKRLDYYNPKWLEELKLKEGK